MAKGTKYSQEFKEVQYIKRDGNRSVSRHWENDKNSLCKLLTSKRI